MVCSVTPKSVQEFVFKWTPRVLVAGFTGYYSLGVAYGSGLMAAIDRLAIPIIRTFVGYAGLGATMPVFQWYSSLGVRVISAGIAGIIYDQIEKLICGCMGTCRQETV